MKTFFDAISYIALFMWPMICMMSPMAIAAHGAYEKHSIGMAVFLSYPMLIFAAYWHFDASLNSISGLTLLRWGLFIVGTPVLVILFNAVRSLLKSTYHNALIFPPLQGRLLYKGAPASKAQIIRAAILRGSDYSEDSFYVNEDGTFNIPTKVQRIRISPMAPFALRKYMRVKYNEESFFISNDRNENPLIVPVATIEPVDLNVELTQKR